MGSLRYAYVAAVERARGAPTPSRWPPNCRCCCGWRSRSFALCCRTICCAAHISPYIFVSAPLLSAKLVHKSVSNLDVQRACRRQSRRCTVGPAPARRPRRHHRGSGAGTAAAAAARRRDRASRAGRCCLACACGQRRNASKPSSAARSAACWRHFSVITPLYSFALSLRLVLYRFYMSARTICQS